MQKCQPDFESQKKIKDNSAHDPNLKEILLLEVLYRANNLYKTANISRYHHDARLIC
jgi:hypothetical protein